MSHDSGTRGTSGTPHGAAPAHRSHPRGPRFASLALLLVWLQTFAPAVALADIDPPGPPTWEEYVYLHTLTLTTDQDDGFALFDGETEIMIRITTTHAGHTSEWVASFEHIDMDPPNDTSFTVIDGTLTAPERKSGKLLVFNHLECDPTPAVVTTIKVYETNSEWVSAVMESIGVAAGKVPVQGDLSTGIALAGAAAKILGQILQKVGNNEELLGSDSESLPVGVSGPYVPTLDYRYKMQYDKSALNGQQCGGTTIDNIMEILRDLNLPDFLRNLWTLEWLGFDEEHPFTKNANVCARRQPHLLGALDAIAHGGATEPGTDSTGTAALKDSVRVKVVQLGREPLVTELSEGIAGGLPPSLIAFGQQMLSQGDFLAANGSYASALQTYANAVQTLLPQNHPDFTVSVQGGPLSGVGLSIVGLQPNPSAAGFRFGVRSSREDDLDVDIVDAAGRLVTTLAHARYPAGVHAFLWDGRARDGRMATPGVYFARARGKSGKDVAKMTLIR